MESVKSRTATTGSFSKTAEQKGLDIWFNRQAEQFERTRLGWMAIYITVSTCLGSIALMHILQSGGSDLSLVLCAAVAMACNSIFIAQGPAKWCLISFYLSVLVNTALLLFHL
jgi:hypothetical protein